MFIKIYKVMWKRNIYFILLLLLLLSACVAGPNTSSNIPSANGDLAGFFMGLWHGIIAPVTFVLSLIFDKISLYEVHNTGGWYDLGFVLGAGILFGGGGRASRKRS